MKRFILFVTIAALPLAACEPYEGQRQRIEVSEAMATARQHLENAASGSRHVRWAEDEPDHEQYRQQELRQAAEAIRPLLTAGSPAEQYAARILLAQVHASAGQIAARDAALAASRQGGLTVELIGLASALQGARVAAAERASYDYQAHLGRLAEAERELLAEREQASAEADEIAARIESLDASIEEYRGQRRELSARADDFFRREFQASGEEAYELHLQGADAGRRADQLTAETERVEAQRSIEQSRLNLARARVEQLDDQAGALRESIEAIEARSEEAAELAADAAERADAIGEQFDARLGEVLEGWREGVERRFDEAMAELAEALEQVEAAERTAPPAERDAVRTARAAAHARIGHVLHQRVVVESGHHDLLASLLVSLEAAEPERAGRIAELAEHAAEAASAASTEARDHLAAALEDFEDLAETARNRQTERAAREHLVEVHRAIAALDDSFQSGADEHRERLRELAED